MKSDNLQYNTLARWVNGTNNSSTKRLMFQSLFFLSIISYRLRALKTLYFYFCNFIKKNKKIDRKDFCKEFCKKSWKKNNAWNIRRLVDDSFVPSSKQPSILYCKLTDFKSWYCYWLWTLWDIDVKLSDETQMPNLPVF